VTPCPTFHLAAEITRVHQPQRDGEDPFLPAAPYDDEAAALPGLKALDPGAVAAEALQLEAHARGRGRGLAADGSSLPRAGRSRARPLPRKALGVSGSVSGWSDLPLLDRSALEERLVQELVAKVGGRGGRGRACAWWRWKHGFWDQCTGIYECEP
jgi:hypothetical protein